MIRSLRVAATLIAVLLVSFPATAQAQKLTDGTMSIVGEGEFEVPPQHLTFAGRVTHSGPDAAAARDPVLAALPAIRAKISELEARGLKITSSDYELRSDQPNLYTQDSKITDEERQRRVYTATQRYSFAIDDLSQASSIVAELARADVELLSISFSIDDEAAAHLGARKAAAEDALRQAKVYAEALGVELVGIKSITDGNARADDGGQADATLDTSVPVEITPPESLTFYGSVDVVWIVRLASP